MVWYRLELSVLCVAAASVLAAEQSSPTSRPVACEQADGYHGLWSAGGELPGEYKYRYSGGLATFSAGHVPMAVYSPKAEKTFFVYGGMPAGGHLKSEDRRLLIMVSYFDHKTGMVPRPRILLDRQAEDSSDNPTLSMDSQGRLWVFVGAFGGVRPSYIFRGTEPYSIDSFEPVDDKAFLLPQPWYVEGKGFILLYTVYEGAINRLCAMTSKDGVSWSEPTVLAAIEAGHGQVSWRFKDKVGTAFDYVPRQGGEQARTNLYYMETRDFGKTWVNAKGEKLELPLAAVENKALVRDYSSSRRLIRVKDLTFDTRGNPIILHTVSRGHHPGPPGGPHIWTTARWTGREWELTGVVRSGNSFDVGSLILERMDRWWLIAPTDKGPAPYYLGGEVVAWFSRDQGASWARWTFTDKSEFNHASVRRPVDGTTGFWVFWADGDARKPSESRLYFADREGIVYRLPTKMTSQFEKPTKMPLPVARHLPTQPATFPTTLPTLPAPREE